MLLWGLEWGLSNLPDWHSAAGEATNLSALQMHRQSLSYNFDCHVCNNCGGCSITLEIAMHYRMMPARLLGWCGVQLHACMHDSCLIAPNARMMILICACSCNMQHVQHPAGQATCKTRHCKSRALRTQADMCRSVSGFTNLIITQPISHRCPHSHQCMDADSRPAAIQPDCQTCNTISKAASPHTTQPDSSPPKTLEQGYVTVPACQAASPTCQGDVSSLPCCSTLIVTSSPHSPAGWNMKTLNPFAAAARQLPCSRMSACNASALVLSCSTSLSSSRGMAASPMSPASSLVVLASAVSLLHSQVCRSET